MSDNLDLNLEELVWMSTDQAFRTLFRTENSVPPRLYEPARSLALGQDKHRSAELRTMDLAQMSRDTEAIFREHLSPLSVVANPAQRDAADWPIALARWTELLHHRAYETLAEDILPDLCRQGFKILPVAELDDDAEQWIHRHFREKIYPLLTPLAVDPGRPFPFISSDSLNLLVVLEGDFGHAPRLLSRVKIPSITPRLIRIPQQAVAAPVAGIEHPPATYVWSIDVVRRYLSELFVGMPICDVHCFRVFRAPTTVTASARQTPDVQDVHGRRARGSVIRVDVESDIPPPLFDWLVHHLDVISYSVVRYESPDVAMSLPQLAEAMQEWAAQ
jgi:polyphosphate kinase